MHEKIRQIGRGEGENIDMKNPRVSITEITNWSQLNGQTIDLERSASQLQSAASRLLIRSLNFFFFVKGDSKSVCDVCHCFYHFCYLQFAGGACGLIAQL